MPCADPSFDYSGGWRSIGPFDLVLAESPGVSLKVQLDSMLGSEPSMPGTPIGVRVLLSSDTLSLNVDSESLFGTFADFRGRLNDYLLGRADIVSWDAVYWKCEIGRGRDGLHAGVLSCSNVPESFALVPHWHPPCLKLLRAEQEPYLSRIAFPVRHATLEKVLLQLDDLVSILT